MDKKELQLDLEATLTEVLFGHGQAHYGYWPTDQEHDLTVEALGKAQQAYLDLLVSKIPEGTKSILDVGSGTGANALALTEKGYQLECLCPSDHLNELARAKLPADVKVHTVGFENYETDRQFDMALFAESFHYIELEKALEQLARFVTGHVLMFDYFRVEGTQSEGGTRGTYSEFLKALEAQGVFSVVSDDDLTQQILPTFQVLDRAKNDYIGPFVNRARTGLAESYPFRMRLVNLIFGKTLDKIERPSTRADTFPNQFEYRLILLKRT